MPVVVPLTTDDDDVDYAYAPWVSLLFGELAPETPETQGGI
jgi:hypothetical protein